MRPQPEDLPEVTHLKPVPDSRGLALAPADDGLAWTGGRHAQVPGPHYAAPGTPTTLRPCYVCGEPAPKVVFLYATDLEYAVCGLPLDFGDKSGAGQACLDRAQAKRDEERARRSAEVATAAVQGAARAREETTPQAPATASEAPAVDRPRQARDALGKFAGGKETAPA